MENTALVVCIRLGQSCISYCCNSLLEISTTIEAMTEIVLKLSEAQLRARYHGSRCPSPMYYSKIPR